MLKATGIVRKLDSLGRFCIPKELRTVLNIKTDDPLEIFTDRNGQITLQKYSDESSPGEGSMGLHLKNETKIIQKLWCEGKGYIIKPSEEIIIKVCDGDSISFIE